MRQVAAVGFVCLGLLCLPPAAWGTTVEFVEDYEDAYWSVYDRAGEPNQLSVTFGPKTGRLTVEEKGRAALRAGHRCTRRSRKVVTCRGNPSQDVYVDTGKGDDRLLCRGLVFAIGTGPGDDYGNADCTVYVYGGTGNDHLVGGSYGEILVGGPGRDWIEGGGGDDLMFGDGDVDVLFSHGDETSLFSSDEPDRYTTGHRPDVFDGGPGIDTVNWLDHGRKKVRVDLAAGTGPDGDRLTAVENATGGQGNDLLLGSSEGNHLYGASGRDTLVGRGGRDILSGGEYPDNDFEKFRCGRGWDSVEMLELGEIVPMSCEGIAVSSRRGTTVFQAAFPRAVSRRRVAVATYCSPHLFECSRRATLRSGRRVVGRGPRVTFEPGRTWLPVRLTRALPRNKPVRVTIDGEDLEVDSTRLTYKFEWRIRCAGPPACRPAR